MARIRSVSARQKKWVAIECDACGVRYSCLVEGFGYYDDAVIPFSRDSLKDVALYDLSVDLENQASSIPCPECGAYQDSHVAKVRKRAKRLVEWGLSAGIFIVIVLLAVALAPRTPAWIFLFVLVGAWILPRFFSGPFVDRFDPNRDVERNRRYVRMKIANGLVRIEAGSEGPGDGAPPVPPFPMTPA